MSQAKQQATEQASLENKQGLAEMFADFMVKMAGGDTHDLLYQTAFSLSKHDEQGHVCLNLKHLAQKPWHDGSGFAPDMETWRTFLLQTPCVVDAGDNAPMILDGDLLYFQRFWSAEKHVADALLTRLKKPINLDERGLKEGLTRLFAKNTLKNNEKMDWQKIAAALAVRQRFSVISGGPGTGKTTSLVKVLALLLEQNEDMRIRLAAPTGKAAARMMASIRSAKQNISTDDTIRRCIPEEAATLHRLLGFSPRGYRHHHDNPLLLDCLVIDEASMIDLPIMARVLDAIPQDARLILLGDRDQLSSVDAGNILGDITGHGQAHAYSPDMAQKLANDSQSNIKYIPHQASASPIQDSIALLHDSYRFTGPIADLATAVNQGDDVSVFQILQSDSSMKDSTCVHWQADSDLNVILEAAAKHYKKYLQCTDVQEALACFETCRILCAVRQGNEGVETINRLMQQHLLGDMEAGKAVHGMPIMILHNHHELGLFNGDTGLLWNIDGSLQACFFDVSGEARFFPLYSLPHYEPCWAMTVHKSQGSEFEHVFLILPSQEGSHHILGRELFYTAITRSKQSFHLHASAENIRTSVKQRILRTTGLKKRLGW
ncbi:MAG: exodeoxyribonuclease V subunit alpha [Mariprofundaceae bacterium]|nr:exodeoxyribonuclease V subunit alpha [Mariprofundaceae bacterium]